MGQPQKQESCDQAEGQGARGQQTAEDVGQKDLQPPGAAEELPEDGAVESVERRKEAGWEKAQ